MELGPDKLRMLNSRTKTNINVGIRILHVKIKEITGREGKKDFAILSACLVDSHGDYCGLEVLIFGDVAQRRAHQEKYDKVFADGLSYNLSHVQQVKPADPRNASYSVMQVVRYIGPQGSREGSARLSPIMKGSEADQKLPKMIEPKTVWQDMLLSESARQVDFVGLLKSVAPAQETPKGIKQEFVFLDEHGNSIAFTWWRPPHTSWSDMEGKPVFVYKAWLQPGTTQDAMKPLSSTSETCVAVPEQDGVGDHVQRLFDKADELLASTDTISLTSVSEEYQSQDFSTGECVQINVWALTLAMNSSLVLPDQVFQIPGVIIELDATGGHGDTAGLLTKHGDRLFVAATLSDYSGRCKVRVNHACALNLSKLTDQSTFLDQVNSGTLELKRSTVRVRRTVGKPLENSDNGRDRGEHAFVGLVVVAVSPFLTGSIPCDIAFFPSEDRVLPATLASLQVSSLGTFIVKYGSCRAVASAVLLLLRASKKAITRPRDGGFAIRNPEVIDAASADSAPSAFSTFTLAPVDMLIGYQLHCMKVSLCLCTGATPQDDNDAMALTVSQMWTADEYGIEESHAVSAWQQELLSVEKNLHHNPYSKKRKAADLSAEEIISVFTPSPKRPRMSFSAGMTSSSPSS